MGARLLRRVVSLLTLPVLIAGLMIMLPQPALAASGGRIGGGSFRSSPSMPRSYGGGMNRGGYGGGVGYGGGYRGGYGGGGFGFPFIVPIFGFGGGLFGFLIMIAVAGMVMNALRGAGGGAGDATGSGDRLGAAVDGPVSIVQVQVGLLASARALQSDLRRLASDADTSNSAGLQRVLQQASLALLRNPDLWVYAAAELGQVPFVSAETTFNRLSLQERSKLQRELTVNVAGQRHADPAPVLAGASDAASDFIAVTLLVASRRRLTLAGADTADSLRQSLQQLGAVGAEDLLALEVIWQPEGAGEVLSSEELITAYPNLQHL